ncbi:S-M checkpoint control protein rad4 [Nannizzia gypsea CBS 118893]|uniref:S-M checkpoint control protein rad4 n=1 Tax=Arthroderma gypseum (strain ATCC MYA-4604 / CBS 118893) TaxID=535722 RepID=E4V3W2_ARTGP|nr:S-M checkpoint control protein rad4 [Nannizzia gypsea CBS 118893]EFR04686.1 S-M checkpoint control protein rad4 [Nannizzia gypsea CBS 118893]
MAQDAELAKELPLTGVILCCTSILAEHRSQLTDVACQMGAIHKFDLTSEVTHLIVGDINTPKYKYVAKMRTDVKVLRAEWVEAVRSSWIQGGDTDIHALETEYRLPTFFGLSICITGFEDTGFRSHLEKTVSANGGEFRRDLTKAVTHLVARTCEGNKYKFAIQWGVKVVSLKWLEDSIKRTMALDETLYDPQLSLEEQGVGAWNRAMPTVVKRIVKHQDILPPRTRKLRKVASMKLGDQTEGIWSALVPNHSTAAENNDNSQYDGSQQLTADSRSNLLDTKSFASETTFPDRYGSVSHEIKPSPTAEPEKTPSKGFWDNCRFFITGFTAEQTQILEIHLTAQDARISPSLDDLLKHDNQLFVLVPYSLPRREIPGIDDDLDELEIVTDMWVERCLRNQAFVAPEAHITSTPFPKFPIPAFQGMKICSTGFSGIDLLHLSKLINLLGATYDEYLTANASVLICNTSTPSPEKLRHVFEWNIPPVIADWLWISVQTGEKKPYQPYLIPDKRSNSQKGHGLTPRRHGEQTAPLGHYSIDQESPDALQNRDKDNKEREADTMETQLTAPLKEVPTNLPPKPSRSPSPQKGTSQLIQSAPPAPFAPDDSVPNPKANSETKISLNTAISELLKQKRLRSQNSTAEAEVPVRPQRRRKLLGRASSSCSTLTTADAQRGISRASSIDTLNEDGYGSIIDGLDSPSTKAPSCASLGPQKGDVAHPEQMEAQQMLQRRLALFQSNSANGEFAEKAVGEDEPLPLTQLEYDDPDAVAMREMISNQSQRDDEAGEGTGPGGSRIGRKLVIGKLQDSRGGRITRSRKSEGW